MDRFSPNFNSSEALGFCNVRPFPSYSHIYHGINADSLQHIAYYFAYDYANDADPISYTQKLRSEIANWQMAHLEQELLYFDDDHRAIVIDTRKISIERFVVLKDIHRWCLLSCDTIKSLAQLENALPSEFKREDLHKAMANLIERRLVMNEGNQYLSLPISMRDYHISEQAIEHMLGNVSSDIPSNLLSIIKGFYSGNALDRDVMQTSPE
jgi:hypothetical protein